MPILKDQPMIHSLNKKKGYIHRHMYFLGAKDCRDNTQ